MEIFKKKANKNVSYTIYKEEYNYGVPKYFMKNNTTQDGKYEKINFDVDTRGGLKLIRLNETVDELPGNATLFLTNVTSDFFPITVVRSGLFKDEDELTLCEDDNIYSIMENTYLKTKPKYVNWDGVIVKVKFAKNEARMGRDYEVEGTNHLYLIVDDISKDSH